MFHTRSQCSEKPAHHSDNEEKPPLTATRESPHKGTKTQRSQKKKKRYRLWGTSPVAPWLRLCLPMQGLQVQSLMGVPRSHMPHCSKTKTKNRSSIVTNSINNLKKRNNLVSLNKRIFLCCFHKT